MANHNSKKREEYADEGVPVFNQGYLPSWWSWLSLSLVAIAIIMPIYLHGIQGYSQSKQYQQEVALFEFKHPVQEVALNSDGSNPLRGDSASIAEGQKRYEATCAACHKNDLSGVIGPSLADSTWLHGDTDKEIFHIVMEGVDTEHLLQNPPNGTMPAHNKSIGTKGVLEILAFIASKNTSLKAK
ncbi:MAG: c-type cytochrome [Leptonema sp. (in: Bacteria)]|nr:c-type cytochrome [Leptonema sp. (in: bacteria)]